MSEDQSKKRKLEGELSMPNQTEVRSMISMWSQEQLMTALAILGSEMPDVLAHIQTENDRDPKMRKLFVRNLSFESNSETLQKAFAEFGTIEEAVVIMNKSTGRSKGFGFVTYTTAADADKVVRMGTVDLDGRGVYVSLAAKGRSGNGPQHSSGPSFRSGPSYGGGGGGGTPSANAPLSTDQAACKLFIRQLDFKTTSETLHQVFSEFGPVKEAVVLEHPSGGSKGYGFITFENSAGAQAALVEPNKTIDGRMTMTKLASDHSDRPQRNQQQQPPPSSYGGYGGYGGSGGYGGYTGGYNPPTGGYNPPTGGYNAPPPPMPNFGMPEAPPSAPFGGTPPAPYGMPPAPLGSMGWPPSYN